MYYNQEQIRQAFKEQNKDVFEDILHQKTKNSYAIQRQQLSNLITIEQWAPQPDIPDKLKGRRKSKY